MLKSRSYQLRNYVAVQEHFHSQNWTDGLPVVPPTQESDKDFRWHDLRHCCASYMPQDGKSLGHIGNTHLGQNLLPVQNDIRASARKKLLRLESQFPKDCMENLRTNGFFKNCKIRKPLVLHVWQGSSVG